jgi:hypothetical protein
MLSYSNTVWTFLFENADMFDILELAYECSFFICPKISEMIRETCLKLSIS